MKKTMRCPSLSIFACVLLLGQGLHAHALPIPASSLTWHGSVRGLWPKIHIPKVNLGKGAKALLYPVVKTAGNGGKAVVGGGVATAKTAQKGIELYEAGRALSSKTNGIAHLK